jgi:hypothetical protein
VAEKTLAQKLSIRPGYRLAIVNRPVGSDGLVAEIASDASLADRVEAADAALLFVAASRELGQFWPDVSSAARPDATLWIAYPKRTSSIATDLSRDHGWEPVVDDGFDAVSQVSLDDTWSALRFRRDPTLRAERAARGRLGPGHRPIP